MNEKKIHAVEQVLTVNGDLVDLYERRGVKRETMLEIFRLARSASYLVRAARAAVNHLKVCEAGLIHPPFKSRSLPMLREALSEFERPARDLAGLDRDTARKLVEFVARHMERESRLLQPNPQVFMNDAYGLLDLIRAEAKLKAEEIDAWMVEAQKK